MTPGTSIFVKCPYCGAKKELMTLASGNTFGAKYWSDNKRIAPMLPSISPVQQCPDCKKYYLKNKQEHEDGKDYSFNRGELSYPEWKNAYEQFLTETDSSDEHIHISSDDLVNIRFWLIQAYNDYFFRNKTSEASMEETIFIQGIILDFIETFDWTPVEKPLMKAEFYREANRMKQCAEVLATMNYEELEDFEKVIYDGIKERMEKGESIVFELHI